MNVYRNKQKARLVLRGGRENKVLGEKLKHPRRNFLSWKFRDVLTNYYLSEKILNCDMYERKYVEFE